MAGVSDLRTTRRRPRPSPTPAPQKCSWRSAKEVDGDVVSIGEQVRGIQTRRERLVDLYVRGDLDKASYRRRSEELDAELHAAELAFADRLTHNTLVGIPTTYDALEELWG